MRPDLSPEILPQPGERCERRSCRLPASYEALPSRIGRCRRPGFPDARPGARLDRFGWRSRDSSTATSAGSCARRRRVRTCRSWRSSTRTPTLLRSYGERYKLPESALFTDFGALLDRTKPEAVASFSNTYDHPEIVEAAAARRVHVMMEKPLAVSNAHAQRIRRAAEKAGIQVFVNYETTWYPSHGTIWTIIKEKRAAGEIRKMVALDGHSGPKAINVQPEFLAWLSDPVKNGAGALYDFGCYGANLMTWLMDNQRPLAVTAVTQQHAARRLPARR